MADAMRRLVDWVAGLHAGTARCRAAHGDERTVGLLAPRTEIVYRAAPAAEAALKITSARRRV